MREIELLEVRQLEAIILTFHMVDGRLPLPGKRRGGELLECLERL